MTMDAQPSVRANEGVVVNTSCYKPIPAWRLGPELYHPELQDAIHGSSSELSDFFPRVEREGETALFKFPASCRGLFARRSQPLRPCNLPPRELAAFKGAMEKLEKRARDPGASQRERQVLGEIELPHPDFAPELYRLNGPFWNRRLMVLWGCERVEGTSLAPAEALARLANYQDRLYAARPWVMAMLLLLAGSTLAAFALWPTTGPTPGVVAGGSKEGIVARVDKTAASTEATAPNAGAKGGRVLTVTPLESTVMETVTARVTQAGTIDFGGRREVHVRASGQEQHRFDQAGDYKVKWTPSDGSKGEEATVRVRAAATQTADAKKGPAVKKPAMQGLTATLIVSPQAVKPGVEVTARADASFSDHVQDRSKIVRHLDWGDGSESLKLDGPDYTAKHAFKEPGEYKLQLRVEQGGDKDSDEKTVVVSKEGLPAPSSDPVVTLTLASMDSPKKQVEVVLESRPAEDLKYYLAWGDDGDDDIKGASDKPPIRRAHRYADPKTYTIEAWCEDVKGRVSKRVPLVVDLHPDKAGNQTTKPLPIIPRKPDIPKKAPTPQVVSTPRKPLPSKVEPRPEDGTEPLPVTRQGDIAEEQEPIPQKERAPEPAPTLTLAIEQQSKPDGNGVMTVVLGVNGASVGGGAFTIDGWLIDGKPAGKGQTLTVTKPKGTYKVEAKGKYVRGGKAVHDRSVVNNLTISVKPPRIEEPEGEAVLESAGK